MQEVPLWHFTARRLYQLIGTTEALEVHYHVHGPHVRHVAQLYPKRLCTCAQACSHIMTTAGITTVLQVYSGCKMLDDHYLHTADDSKAGIPTVFRNQKDLRAFSRALRAAVLLLFGMDVLPWISQMGLTLGQSYVRYSHTYDKRKYA
jgi:hypothetical protein